MAGIGVKLNRIYQKNTITTNIVGFFYSMTMTIAPVLVVIINLMLMQKVLKFNTVRYIDSELFSCTVLYVFIFSLLTTSPFNAVLSRYMSDAIFEERYEDVLPCHRIGLLINICFSCLFAIPFCGNISLEKCRCIMCLQDIAVLFLWCLSFIICYICLFVRSID